MASLRARGAVGVAVASVVTLAAVAVAVRTLRPLGVADASTTQLWITVALVAVVSGAAAIGVTLIALRERGDRLARLAEAMQSLAQNTDGPNGTLTALPPRGERSPIEQAVAELHERQQLALGAERAAADRYRAMIDTVASSVFAIDGGGRIIATNTAAAAMFGRTRETMLGSLLFDLVAAESLHMTVDELGTVRIPALTNGARGPIRPVSGGSDNRRSRRRWPSLPLPSISGSRPGPCASRISRRCTMPRPHSTKGAGG